MKNVLFPCLFFLLCFYSCKESIEEYRDPNILREEIVAVKVEKEIAKETAVIFFNALMKSQGEKYSTSKISKAISKVASSIDLEEVKYNDETVFWVANYPDNLGYTILSADKNQFPIVAYSSEGNFTYNELSTNQKQDFDIMVLNAYSQKYLDSNIQDCLLWSDISQAEASNNNSDTVTIVDVDFFSKKSAIENSNNAILAKSGGAIPDRKYPKGYPPVFPLLWKNRQWTSHWPYNYDMPLVILGDTSSPFSGNGNGPAYLPDIVVGLTLLMDYHQYPNPDFWQKQPNAISSAQSTELTRFLKQLTYDIGGQYYINTIGLSTNALFTSIPSVLNSKYGFNSSSLVKYPADQTSFDNIKNSLYNNKPVLYQTGIPNKGSALLGKCSIIDGVYEMYVTVTTTKYFLGIKVKRTVNHYYMDYFHYVSMWGRESDCWGKYDVKKTNNSAYSDYVFLNFSPK